MADSIKKIASEREDGIEELKKMVEEYEDTSKHAVPRLLPPKEERQGRAAASVDRRAKGRPNRKRRVSRTGKAAVHIQEEDEDEEDKEETVSSATPSS